jgi:hypothetical protein
MPICLYGEIDLKSGSGLNDRIHCSQWNGVEDFVASVVAMRNKSTANSPDHLSTDAKPSNAEGSNLGVAYANESEGARRLALEHGKLWEFVLVEELLKSKLQTLKNECDQFDQFLRSTPRKRFTGGLEFTNWLRAEMGELLSTIEKIKVCMTKELIESLGAAGVSGDAIKILNSVNALFGHTRRFLIFELIVSAANVPFGVQGLKAAFRGITASVVGFIEEFIGEWGRNLDALRKGSHTFNLEVTLSCPPQIQKASEQVVRFNLHPELLR